MLRFEPVLQAFASDWLVVVGDVNWTMACTLVASKRIVTDALADLLLTPSPGGDENLRREGVAELRIRQVGNVMTRWCETSTRRVPAGHRSSSGANGAATSTSRERIADAPAES